MSVRAALHAVTPPLVWRAGRRLRDRWRGERAGAADEIVFAGNDWAEAEARFAPRGWQGEATLAHYRRTWPAFLETISGSGPIGVARELPYDVAGVAAHNTFISFAYALCVSAHGRSSLSMLDWGGCFGHYCALARTLQPAVALDYHCKDHPILTAQGRTLFPDQTFHDDDGCLERRYDFVLASGSLQYMDDWRGTLERLAQATSGHLLVTRLPVVTSAPAYVFLHRPPAAGTEYLAWCLPREAFLDAARAAGLELEREFLLAERHAVAGAPEAPQYLGFLFRQRSGDDGGGDG